MWKLSYLFLLILFHFLSLQAWAEDLKVNAENSSLSSSPSFPAAVEEKKSVDASVDTEKEKIFGHDSLKDKLSKMTMTMIFIVGVIMALFYFSKRTPLFRSITHNPVRVISVLPISPKQKLAVIEVVGSYLLLGITEHNINRLHELTAEQVKDLTRTRKN